MGWEQASAGEKGRGLWSEPRAEFDHRVFFSSQRSQNLKYFETETAERLARQNSSIDVCQARLVPAGIAGGGPNLDPGHAQSHANRASALGAARL